MAFCDVLERIDFNDFWANDEPEWDLKRMEDRGRTMEHGGWTMHDGGRRMGHGG